MDKERHGVVSENHKSKPVQTGSELKDADDAKEQPTSSGSGLPGFPISVFKDLVLINASVEMMDDGSSRVVKICADKTIPCDMVLLGTIPTELLTFGR